MIRLPPKTKRVPWTWTHGRQHGLPSRYQRVALVGELATGVDYADARQALQRLQASNVPLHYTGQNAAEFWRVATGSATSRNGFGWTTTQASQAWQSVRLPLVYLPETLVVIDRWDQIVTTYGVVGGRAHDARLAAFVQEYRLTGILTFNTGDFARYGIVELHPAQV